LPVRAIPLATRPCAARLGSASAQHAEPGKVNLYVGKTAVKFNIPEAEAVDRLKDLIREHGKWVEPAQEAFVLEPALWLDRRDQP
jgi:4-hydroxy-3-methylbut-2-en-1-yl diphosphate synthase IspG/GcpE